MDIHKVTDLEVKYLKIYLYIQRALCLEKKQSNTPGSNISRNDKSGNKHFLTILL